jgi:5-methylcytosine-specific restriction endonuclease McrA
MSIWTAIKNNGVYGQPTPKKGAKGAKGKKRKQRNRILCDVAIKLARGETVAPEFLEFAASRGTSNVSSKKQTPAKQSPRKKSRFSGFYASEEWKRARYAALLKSDGSCECCGASKRDGIRLNVDHKEPLSKRWDLRLEPRNHQVLCASCNWGKGGTAKDWTDQDPDELTASFRAAMANDRM